jgi:hypothetical protein
LTAAALCTRVPGRRLILLCQSRKSLHTELFGEVRKVFGRKINGYAGRGLAAAGAVLVGTRDVR